LRLRRRLRRGEGGIGAVAAVSLILLALVGYVAMAWVPVWFDFLAAREICSTVVLDWENHQELRQAQGRFQEEHRRKGISDDLTLDDCQFVDKINEYEVDCDWTQYAYYPGTDYYKAFPLSVHVRLEGGKAVVVP